MEAGDRELLRVTEIHQNDTIHKEKGCDTVIRKETRNRPKLKNMPEKYMHH